MFDPRMLDPNLPIPLYYQLKTVLLQKIQSGEWRPGTNIPTESELTEMYGISRTTVREAVSVLVHEGYLSKKQGRGTSVNSPRFQERLGRLTGFAEEMQQQGFIPSAHLVGIDEDVARDLDFAKLGQTGGERWVKFERIRLASGDPIAVERSYWPRDIADLLRKEDLNEVAFYATLEKNGIHLSNAEESISAVNASREDASQLGVRTGTALMEMRRLAYDVQARLIEYTCTRYLGDRYTYRVQLQR